MKSLKDIISERLKITKNTRQYTIDDITAKELCELVEKYKEYHGVLPHNSNSTKMDLHDIYGEDDKNLPFCKARGNLDIQFVYLGGIARNPVRGDFDYGLTLIGTKNQTLHRYGKSELLDALGEDCLLEIYNFLKRKVEELDKQE